MTDPSLDKLLGPDYALEFDPKAANDLQRRLETQRQTAAAIAGTTQIIPYLTVSHATRAIEFYISVLGAMPVGEEFRSGDGRITHAELRVGAITLYLSDSFPESNLISPDAADGVAVSLVIHVADADLTMAAAEAAGASVERPVTDQWGTRSGWFVDPFGHRWSPTSHNNSTQGASHD